jgi:hypothetical protein
MDKPFLLGVHVLFGIKELAVSGWITVPLMIFDS